MKRILLLSLLMSLLLFTIGYSQTIQVIKDGVVQWQYSCTSSPSPPQPPATGIWTNVVNNPLTLHLRNRDTQTGQYLSDPTENLGMAQGSTKYALIDPKGFAIPFKSCYTQKGVLWCPRIYFQAIDPQQGQGMKVSVMAYKLDASNNQIRSFQVLYSGDVVWNEQAMTQEEYNTGVKWLIEFMEQGYGSGRYTRIGWMFQ